MKELLKISLNEDNDVQTDIRIRNREEYDIISGAFLDMLEDFTKEYKGDLRKEPIKIHPALTIIGAVGTVLAQNKELRNDDKTSAASPPLQPWVEQTRFRRNLFENQ